MTNKPLTVQQQEPCDPPSTTAIAFQGPLLFVNATSKDLATLS